MGAWGVARMRWFACAGHVGGQADQALARADRAAPVSCRFVEGTASIVGTLRCTSTSCGTSSHTDV